MNKDKKEQDLPREGEEKLLRVGQLAERSGKTVRALHLYEELGLLRPVHRTKGGFRLYSPRALERVEWISLLQEADVSLHEIQAFLRDLEEERVAGVAMMRVRQLFEQKLASIREQQRRLARLEKEFVAALAYLDACRACEPQHETSECGDCRLHGHDGRQPLMVAGLHNT
ncbi:MAG: MerR family transcriptional regulator [Myxococcales bacterium]|nr:MerR family transcriptional regulator [Myxococcota bacterium]MDW8284120.1 MerR family transcriptional regulator [Myxococcales bacterium]